MIEAAELRHMVNEALRDMERAQQLANADIEALPPPCPGDVAVMAGLAPETSREDVVQALTEKVRGRLRFEMSAVGREDVDGVDATVNRVKEVYRRHELIPEERIIRDAAIENAIQSEAEWILSERERRAARKQFWVDAWERAKDGALRREIEDGERDPPEPDIVWRVGTIGACNRQSADFEWIGAMVLRRERGAPLTEDDTALARVMRYQYGPQAATNEQVIEAIEKAFPDWEREARLKELSREIASLEPEIRWARKRKDGSLAHALIGERQAAIQEEDRLLREQEGLPPLPEKPPRADLSQMSAEEKTARRREQARTRKQRERHRHKQNGDDLKSRVRARLGNCCRLCGGTEDLNLHHHHDVECPTCFPVDDLGNAYTATRQRRKNAERQWRIADAIEDADLPKHFVLLCTECHERVTAGLATIPDDYEGENHIVNEEEDHVECNDLVTLPSDR